MEIVPMPEQFDLTAQVQKILVNCDPYRATLCDFKPHSDTLGYDQLIYDFEVVGLSQHTIFDIKTIEPIEIRIPKAGIPEVFVLREDFPLVPHLTVSEDGTRKSICYSEIPDEELFLRMNARFLVECINNWFKKTGRNELHHPDQPLEPFFLGGKDVAIVRTEFVTNLYNKFVIYNENGYRIFNQVDPDSKEDNAEWYITLELMLPPSSDNIIHHVPHTINELLLLTYSIDIVKLFRNQIFKVWRVRQDPKLYSLLFNQSINALLDCKCIIYLYIPAEYTSKVITRDIKAFYLEGTYSSLISGLGLHYNVKSKKLEALSEKQIKDVPISLLNLHCAFESSFARILNGINPKENNPCVVMVGTGALGSQVFSNSIRAGYGKWTLVDNDILWPHNLARHALGLNSIGKTKASATAMHAKSILPDADVTAISDTIFNLNNTEMANLLKAADIIVDISTSVAAERLLAIDVDSKARRVSFFLNPTGTHLTMLLEDTERRHTLDLLEMQFYKIIAAPGNKYDNYFKSAEIMAYTGSCRSITSKLPQDDIALSAALASKALKAVPQNSDSHIVIWTLGNNDVNVDRFQGETWTIIKQDQWSIYINGALLNEMHTNRRDKAPNETGGVLLGHYDFSRNRLYVIDMIFSPDDSITSPTSYIRGCSNLPEMIGEIAKLTYDNLYYVGEWHSHPNSNVTMSGDDQKLLKVITTWNEVECKPGCMIIVGAEDKFEIYLQSG